MKVGILLSSRPPQVGGGFTLAEELFHSFLKIETESKHSFVLYSHDKEPPSEILSAKNIRFVSLHCGFQKRFSSKVCLIAKAIFKKFRYPTWKFKVKSELENRLLDSVIANGVDMLWFLTPECLTTEVPYICTVWDLAYRLHPYFPEVSANGLWDSREQLYTTVLRRASFVITGTNAGKAEIERFYQVPSERIKVLPFPVPSFVLKGSSHDKLIVEKYGLGKDYLFYPAQFWPHKNHVGLLLAVKLLRDRYNIVLPVVFVGSDKGNLKHIKLIATELDIHKQVHFLGFVPQEDLISLYRRAFALTFTTYFGPDNLPPLEAFALGCPVIASEGPGAEEQLGNAALLVDPKKPEQIAQAIKRLWEDATLRHTLVGRGLARAVKATGEDYVRAVFSLLDEFEPIRMCWGGKSCKSTF
jgi:glycosyltransferase involved in cell wall biosynthesis